MKTKQEWMAEAERQYEQQAGAGIERALATIERMHTDSLVNVANIVADCVSRLEREAGANRAFARDVLQNMVGVRVAAENPAAAKLLAMLERGVAAAAPGAPPASKASTDDGAHRRHPNAEDPDEELRPMSNEEVQSKILATSQPAAFAGVTPPR
jgi:hypothetical protein